MYNIGTVTTTANSTKLVGTGTKWKENISLVSPQQIIQIMIGTMVYDNSIHSIQSNTELTLNFPIPVAAKDAKYVILTTMVDSVTDAGNKIVTMNIANAQYADIQNRIMTESGVIDIKLPNGTVRKTRTEAERDKLLDGKLNQSLAEKISGDNVTWKGIHQFQKWANISRGDYIFSIIQLDETQGGVSRLETFNAKTNERYTSDLPKKTGTLMQVGDYGVGDTTLNLEHEYGSNQEFDLSLMFNSRATGLYAWGGLRNSPNRDKYNFLFHQRWHTSPQSAQAILGMTPDGDLFHYGKISPTSWNDKITFYSTKNTTKDSNGNLKAASPIVKVFADHIETNDEAEGVEMEHLGVGHYLIKGVVGFNADGAWGINNGFVIPQDHNGKNMVLIDYEVRPDGDIEVFVFHQQNVDMPERFQNKRIKYIDKDGNPVYYENYEPCDVPESRWIDMRVEMPSNSIYNLKQAEAERLAKEEAERQAEEDAKRAAEEDI